MFNGEEFTVRTAYQACLKLARESDSKRETAELLEDAVGLLSQLKKLCKHRAVLQVCKEHGEETNMESYWVAEKRLCLVCGLREEGKPHGPNLGYTNFENLGAYQFDRPTSREFEFWYTPEKQLFTALLENCWPVT